MDLDNVISEFTTIWSNLKDTFLAFFPKLLTAIIVLGIGYFLAKLVKYLIIRLIKYSSKLLNQWFKISFSTIDFIGTGKFIGSLFFWIIFLSFLIWVSDILGLQMVGEWMESILQYTPNILAAIFIVVIAIFAGRLLYGITASVSKRVGLDYSNTLGRIVQYVILVTAIIVAIDQLGIEISFLITLISILLATLLFGAALAFGLGAKSIVSNILASFYVRKMYKVGDLVRIHDVEGHISKIDATSVVIDTATGQVVVPAKEFNNHQSVLLKSE